MVVNATWHPISGDPVGAEAIGFVLLANMAIFVLWENKAERRFTAVHRGVNSTAQALDADYWDADERTVTLAQVMGSLIARVEETMP
jgi:hypothetical protein